MGAGLHSPDDSEGPVLGLGQRSELEHIVRAHHDAILFPFAFRPVDYRYPPARRGTAALARPVRVTSGAPRLGPIPRSAGQAQRIIRIDHD